MLTDSSGKVAWQATYDPFGNATLTTSTVTFNLRFPGQYYDAESGLHYNWNRYYDPKTGRYVTSDPIGLAGGLNTYRYVKNNPLGYIDPSGLTNACAPILGCSGDLLPGTGTVTGDYHGTGIPDKNGDETSAPYIVYQYPEQHPEDNSNNCYPNCGPSTPDIPQGNGLGQPPRLLCENPPKKPPVPGDP